MNSATNTVTGQLSVNTITGPAVRNQATYYPYARWVSTANPATTVPNTTAYIMQGTGAWSSDSDQTMVNAYNGGKGMVVPYTGLYDLQAEARWSGVSNSTGTEIWISISGTGVVTPFEVGHVQGVSMNSTSASFRGYLQAGAIIAPTLYCTGGPLNTSYMSMNFQCQKNQ